MSSNSLKINILQLTSYAECKNIKSHKPTHMHTYIHCVLSCSAPVTGSAFVNNFGIHCTSDLHKVLRAYDIQMCLYIKAILCVFLIKK